MIYSLPLIRLFAHPIPHDQFWQNKISVPFLTAAQRKHVQMPVMKTCKQASVTNSLLTLFFYKYHNINPEWKTVRFMRLFET